ncbi:DNA N-glycosylase and apurinic/apyrimidinic (AP) lyase [Mortierella alpina]|nr:DNA N-glycosylase and apurinic/apyrimidinic (AP) lyase [Mortierella alpina]
MTTRSSSRLRNSVKVKSEQGETISAAAVATGRIPSINVATPLRTTRMSRRIVKNEDGEPDEETLARLKLEADELRRALASENVAAKGKRSNAAMRRSGTSRSPVKEEEEKGEETITTADANGGVAKKKSKYATKEPKGWEITLDRLREFRLQNPAPVDTMGCERLAEVGEHIPPEVSRFQTLMSLVLSSQTKDTVTSVAVWRLQKELKGGLTIQGVLDVPAEELNSIISAVGFHNKKTIYMKQVAEICKTKYNGDIPSTAEELIALPGVGPKMAYLTLQCAWNKNLGIGVDTHVHRISNRLGWIKTEKDGPEATREKIYVDQALQSWLPKEHWREINHIMVGFGQVLCLPRGPLCGTCPVQERCPSANVKSKQSKKAIKAEVKLEMEQPFGEVELHEVHVHPSTGVDPLVKMEEKLTLEDELIKQEEEEEKSIEESSPFFSSETKVPLGIKQEESEERALHKSKSVLEELHVNSSNLEKEAADIEDLV